MFNFLIKLSKIHHLLNVQCPLFVKFIMLRCICHLWHKGPLSHCYFTRLNLKKMGPLQFCLPVFLGIHRNPKWHFSIPLPFHDFIQNVSHPSKCLSKWIKVDKWDYLKNPSHETKNSFCLGFLYIPRQTGRQNWRGPIF